MMETVHDSLIGDGVVFNSAFGEKRGMYYQKATIILIFTFVENQEREKMIG